MLRFTLFLVIGCLTMGAAWAQKAAPQPETDRVVQALALSKQSSARMLLARAGGSGRGVIYDALSDAARVTAKGPARDWPEKDLLARLKTAMPTDRWKTFSAMLKAYPSEKRALMLEMLRLRIDLPKK